MIRSSTSLVDDLSLGGDLVDVIRRYQKCLDQDDQDLPDPFILQDIIDKWGNRQGAVAAGRPEEGQGGEADKQATSPLPSGEVRKQELACQGRSPTERHGRDYDPIRVQATVSKCLDVISTACCSITLFSLVCYQKVPGSRYSRVLADAMDRVSRRFYLPVDELNSVRRGHVGHDPSGSATSIRNTSRPPRNRHSRKTSTRSSWALESAGNRSQDEAVPRARSCPTAPPRSGHPRRRPHRQDRGPKHAGFVAEDAVERIRGKPGTSVTLSLNTGGGPADRSSIVRQVIHEDTVRGRLPRSGRPMELPAPGRRQIGYIRIPGSPRRTGRKRHRGRLSRGAGTTPQAKSADSCSISATTGAARSRPPWTSATC